MSPDEIDTECECFGVGCEDCFDAYDWANE